ncbi:MAG: hypothetical protein P8I03_07465 [Thalassotalea sp.]|nr:hypothetical protein [Thalassotalea sp.]
MSLLLVLTASSFFLPQFLSFFLDRDTKSSSVLSYGKAFKLESYFHHQRRNNPIGSSIWLKSTTALIDKKPQYTLELADYYLNNNLQTKAIFWYEQAIKSGFDDARLSLSQLFFDQKNYQQTKTLLSPLVDYSHEDDAEKSLALLIKVALIEGDLAQVSTLVRALESINFQHALLAELEKFQVVQPVLTNSNTSNVFAIEGIDNVRSLDKGCVASIQFFATNFADLRYTQGLIEQISSGPLSKYSCFESVRYIPLNKLACFHEKDEAITCDEAIWQAYKKEIDTRFIGVMVPKGGAKVHNGIMYLDNDDTVDVFAHELAHLLGFIDEYSLPVNHSRCSQVQENAFAYNVAVLAKAYSGSQSAIREKVLGHLPWRSFIKDDTPIMTKEGNKWLIGTPDSYKAEVGLFASDTCQKISSAESVNLQAYKPLSKRTSLNYFELEFPLLYQRLLEKDSELFLMPSFHHNIDKALTH